ncbi:MAG: LacI family transcriptional regulator [Lachnospiraceae bacterium]|nr:LacI family transcriptional regulator [Lachnospiraceae bacterium]
MSLKKIAELAGVSVSTASRVLNSASPTCASRETQDRIWEAARAIGYVPNEVARKLKKAAGTQTERRTETRSVTIVMARVASLEADPFFYELFRSLEVELMRQSMVIGQILYAEESLAESPAETDGFIILGRCSRQLLERVSACNRNIVGIWRNSMDFDVDEVLCDGEKAAELAMEHLLALGHRRIAYIGDCSYESRYVGYCNTLFRNHISMDYNLTRPTDQTREQAEAAFQELLGEKISGKADFSAVFCANDATAVRVLEILAKQKKKLREAISVISIDDIEESQNTKPFLTTIRIPRDEMAHMAVNLLLDRIARGHKEPVRIEFPCRIVQRESCYPCKI